VVGDVIETFFPQCDWFIEDVATVESIRRRLSPTTRTTIDEIGVILPNDNAPVPEPFPDVYWNAVAAAYAYLYGSLSEMAIDYLGMSQLVGYPTQFPSVSMVNWTNGEWTARYWTLKMMIDAFGGAPEPKQIYRAYSSAPELLYAQAYVRGNVRLLLIVNKRSKPQTVILDPLTDWANATLTYVDPTTGFGPPRSIMWPSSGSLVAAPWAVWILSSPL